MGDLLISAFLNAAPAFVLMILVTMSHVGWGLSLFGLLPKGQFQIDTLSQKEMTLLRGTLAFVLGSLLFGMVGQSLAIFGHFGFVFNLSHVVLGFVMFFIFLYKSQTRFSFSLDVNGFKINSLVKAFDFLVLFVFVLNILLFSFLTLHPPGTDAVSFYLTQAKVIGIDGILWPIPTYEAFAQNGLAAEVILGQFFSLKQSLSAKLFFIPVAGSALVLIYAITRMLGGAMKSALGSSILLLTSTAFTLVIWDGKTDLFSLCAGLACIAFLVMQDLSSKKIPTLVLNLSFVGIFMAFAIQLKLSYVLALGPIVTFYLLWSWWEKRFELSLSDVLKFACVLILFFALGLLFNLFKNWHLFQEPLAPFYFFNSQSQSFDLNQVWFDSKITNWILMTYPLALVFGHYPMQHGQVSLLWLVFLPLALAWCFTSTRFKQARLLFIVSLISLLLWAILRPSVLAPRYFLICIATTFPFLVLSLIEWIGRYKSNRVFEKTILIFLSVVFAVVTFRNFERFLSRWHPSLVYAAQTDNGYQDEIWRTLNLVNSLHKPGEQIAFFMYYRYPLSTKALRCVSGWSDHYRIAEWAKRGQFWTGLHAEGYQILVVDHLTLPSMLLNLLESKDQNPLEQPIPPNLEVKKYPIDERFTVFTVKGPTVSPMTDVSHHNCRP